MASAKAIELQSDQLAGLVLADDFPTSF